MGTNIVQLGFSIVSGNLGARDSETFYKSLAETRPRLRDLEMPYIQSQRQNFWCDIQTVLFLCNNQLQQYHLT